MICDICKEQEAYVAVSELENLVIDDKGLHHDGIKNTRNMCKGCFTAHWDGKDTPIAMEIINGRE